MAPNLYLLANITLTTKTKQMIELESWFGHSKILKETKSLKETQVRANALLFKIDNSSEPLINLLNTSNAKLKVLVNGYPSLGYGYQGLGQFKIAIGYHKRHLKFPKEVGDKAEEGIGYEIAKEVGVKSEEGRVYGNLGCVYADLGQLETAIGYQQRGLKICKEVGNKVGEEASYCNLGHAYCRLGQLETAIEYHHRALEIAREGGDKVGEGANFCLLGNIRLSQGEFKAAIECAERHLKIAKEEGDKTGEACSLCSLGKSFERLGNVLKALVYFQSSVEVYDDIRASLQLNDQWKICYRDQHQTAYKGLWRTHLQQGNVVEALLAAEKGRAQSLRDLMDTRYQPGDSSTNNSSNNTFLSAVPSSTVFMAITGPCVYLWVILSNNNIQMRKVHVNSFKYEDDLEIFIEHLNKTALEDIGAKRNVRRENPALDSPKREEMAGDVVPINVWYSKSRALQKLYEIIVTPIADLIEGRELTFVPEGPFCLVPFAALEDSKSTYLGDSFTIRVLPSLTTLQLIPDCSAQFHMTTGALLVGDPCFKDIIYQGRRLQQLPGARKEVEMIGRFLNIAPLTGEMATKDEVLSRMSSVALVHIAAHGKMETGEVFLAPNTTRENPKPQEKDYLMTMNDVAETGLRARLVVLSCCHTARGEVMAEGVVGIARALLGAGARSVVVTLWAIDDEGTLEFMSFFYDALAKGKKASEALNQAMKCMRGIEKFKGVKYWAPFVLIGDDVSLDFNDV
ncbi:tetratricopeptide repeat protein 28-like [Stylophora pistillata]|uniref:tetratricopeptide repeat protein 28-like n=1 Tax=Stylophora pistillata TaxID=50429 RepID=UPI000C052EBD|nr:tetratricopeptide repeat protein 28-like [Stylophora pistillata]